LSVPAHQRIAAVVGLSRSTGHRFSKDGTGRLSLLAGLGVDGDCHAGSTVQHLSRVRRDPGQPNLRQVHLMAAELYDELTGNGFDLAPGQLGENVTTRGVDLLALARGTRLSMGAEVVLEVTGLRNPCVQIDRFRPGLLAEVLYRDAAGQVVRRAGVMAVVVTGGEVAVGDTITVEAPRPPLLPLSPV
jgi:MOSC domain-containing protein YiiM